MNDGQAIFLAGNVSEGFTAFGPYEDFGAAADAHDGEEGWVMTLQTRSTAKVDQQ